jgi:diguanylate cyclase (GGDEF)-like protein/PAS domain S-box-containing protein
MAEQDFSTLFELLPIGAYRSKLDGSVVSVNKALARLNGYESANQMLAQMQDVLANPYLHPSRREEFWLLLRTHGHVTNFETEMLRQRTGEVMWVREHAHIVHDASGQAQYYEGTVEDITAERLAKAALVQREAMLQNVLQTIPDGIWLKDIDGVYMTCNEAFAKACGASVEQVIGRRDADWITYADPAGFLTSDELAIRSRRPLTFEENFGHPQSPLSGVHELIKAPMFDSAGHIIGVLGMARNISQRKFAETQLRDTTEKLELALIGADLGLWEHELSLERGYWMDARSWSLLGYVGDQISTAQNWRELMHAEDAPGALSLLQQYLAGARPSFEVEYRAQHANGQWIWLSSRGKVVQSRPDGSPRRMAGTLMDITARKSSEQKLRAIQAELQATLNALPDLLFEVTQTGLHRAVHCRDVGLLAAPPSYIMNRSVREVLPPHAADVWMQAIEDAVQTGRSNGRQYHLQLRGQTLWFELSVVRKPTERDEEERFIAIARDVTERKTVGDAIAHLAFHDALTGLPNRRLLSERLQRAISASSRNKQYAALMFIDLDGFKLLNDTHGHEVGDLLLIEVAERLRLSVREIDTVARLGGDEFVVLIQDLSESRPTAIEHAQAVGQKILDSLNANYQLKSGAHRNTPSVGIRLFLGDRVNHSDLLQQADAAMYMAKAAGRNTLRFYEAPEHSL